MDNHAQAIIIITVIWEYYIIIIIILITFIWDYNIIIITVMWDYNNNNNSYMGQ